MVRVKKSSSWDTTENTTNSRNYSGWDDYKTTPKTSEEDGWNKTTHKTSGEDGWGKKHSSSSLQTSEEDRWYRKSSQTDPPRYKIQIENIPSDMSRYELKVLGETTLVWGVVLVFFTRLECSSRLLHSFGV